MSSSGTPPVGAASGCNPGRSSPSAQSARWWSLRAALRPRARRNSAAHRETSVIEDALAHGAHPPNSLPGGGRGRPQDALLEAFDVVRVHQVGLRELHRGAGELAEHEGTALVVPAGDVFLGHQVHPVAQRGHQQHVGGEVERDQLGLGQGGVQVVHGQAAERRTLAVDPPHRHLHLVAQRSIALDPLPAGRRHLHEHRAGQFQAALGEQLFDGGQPVQDALGVVEPVHPEEHELRVAQVGPNAFGPGDHVGPGGQLGERPAVDRDREGLGPHHALAAEPGALHRAATGDQAGPAAGPQEVVGIRGPLEADQVGAEQPVEHLAPPRELGEELVRGERDVVEEADPQVRPDVAQHPGHQLELVVLHPDRGAAGRPGGCDVGEPAVDVDVGVPPAPVVDRRGDHVVVERPQGGVRHALVVLGDLPGRQRHRHQVQALGVERRRSLALGARPTHPGATVTADHRLQGSHQAARARHPRDGAVGLLAAVDGQPVGDDDHLGAVAHAALSRPLLPASHAWRLPQRCGASSPNHSSISRRPPGAGVATRASTRGFRSRSTSVVVTDSAVPRAAGAQSGAWLVSRRVTRTARGRSPRFGGPAAGRTWRRSRRARRSRPGCPVPPGRTRTGPRRGPPAACCG